MPYPGQVDHAQIVAQARAMIEAEGAEALSLHKVAAALGVKAPSLYRHVGGKAALLQAVNAGTVTQLFQALDDAGANHQDSPQGQLLAILQAFRRFAHAHPHSYILLFTAQVARTRALRPSDAHDPVFAATARQAHAAGVRFAAATN